MTARLALTLAVCLAAGCAVDGSGDPPSGSDGGTGVDADPNDDTAPSFGGASAVSPVGSSGLLVTYSAATDNATATGDIVYRAYVSTSPAGQSFATPSGVSAPGALEIVVGGLSSDTTYFVVVRAVDGANNEDANSIERSGSTALQVSFSGQVEPILTSDCLGAGCHGAPNPAAKLDLREGSGYGDLVGIVTDQCSTGIVLVVPADPGASYLINKLAGIDMCAGIQMPKQGGLSDADFLTIQDWIAEGALDN